MKETKKGRKRKHRYVERLLDALPLIGGEEEEEER